MPKFYPNLIESLHGLARCEHDDLSVADEAVCEIESLRNALVRCRTVLGNMALENKGAIFRRWPINHEPLRNDARNLLPVIDEVLDGINQSLAAN